MTKNQSQKVVTVSQLGKAFDHDTTSIVSYSKTRHVPFFERSNQSSLCGRRRVGAVVLSWKAGNTTLQELDLFLSSRRFDPDYDPWPFHQQQVSYLEAALEAYELKPAFHSAMHRPEARVVSGARSSMVALWVG